MNKSLLMLLLTLFVTFNTNAKIIIKVFYSSGDGSHKKVEQEAQKWLDKYPNAKLINQSISFGTDNWTRNTTVLSVAIDDGE